MLTAFAGSSLAYKIWPCVVNVSACSMWFGVIPKRRDKHNLIVHLKLEYLEHFVCKLVFYF